MPPVPPSAADIDKILNFIKQNNLHETHLEARAIWETLLWVSGASTHTPGNFITCKIAWLKDAAPDL
jgi:hypothetical protein